MSVEQYQKVVNVLDNDIANLEKEKAAKDKDYASLQCKINSTQKSITKHTSHSTLKSKMHQISYCERDKAKKYMESSELEKKIAEKMKKRSDAYINFRKHSRTSRKNKMK